MLQLQGQLKQNQMELENRQKLVSQLEAQIQEYQTRLNETPVREQQLADLTRDYEQSLCELQLLIVKEKSIRDGHQPGETAARRTVPHYRSAKIPIEALQTRSDAICAWRAIGRNISLE